MPTIDICHALPGQEDTWVTLTVDLNTLSSHRNHPQDIWPPNQEWPQGMNWSAPLIGVWASECREPVMPSPSPLADSPAPTSSPSLFPFFSPHSTAFLLPPEVESLTVQPDVPPSGSPPTETSGISSWILLTVLLLLGMLGVFLAWADRHFDEDDDWWQEDDDDDRHDEWH